MKEQDYINVRELSAVLDAKNILRSIIPANSKVISEEEFREVMSLVSDWEIKLFNIIETGDD